MTTARRVLRQPHAGDTVETRVGPARVVSVHDHGRCLVVDTANHGTETIERADTGHWVTYR
jgi:hypothetical protein